MASFEVQPKKEKKKKERNHTLFVFTKRKTEDNRTLQNVNMAIKQAAFLAS